MSKSSQDQHPVARTPLIWRMGVAVIALLFAAFGFWAQSELKRGQALKLESAQLYPQPKVLNEFSIQGGDGEAFGLDRWRDGWDLIFVGYTHCPDVCPNTLSQLAGLGRKLQPDLELAAQLRVTFLSVDPERDNPAHLSDYVRYFDPEFMSATGDHQQMTELTRQLGAIFHIQEHQAGDQAYAVDHSSAILLVDPEARLYGRFPAPHDISSMAADLTTIIKAF
jgi:protein SCO1/2